MTDQPTPCPFCDLINRNLGGDYNNGITFVYRNDVARLKPLNPVTPGHILFIPTQHVEHPMPAAVALAMDSAARYGHVRGDDFNLITSSGSAATQTVPHLHVHYVPRREGDGLHLPWTGQLH